MDLNLNLRAYDECVFMKSVSFIMQFQSIKEVSLCIVYSKIECILIYLHCTRCIVHSDSSANIFLRIRPMFSKIQDATFLK